MLHDLLYYRCVVFPRKFLISHLSDFRCDNASQFFLKDIENEYDLCKMLFVGFFPIGISVYFVVKQLTLFDI